MTGHHYSIYDFDLYCDFELPLQVTEATKSSSLWIKLAPVPTTLGNETKCFNQNDLDIHLAGSKILIITPDAARFLLDGDFLLVEPLGEARWDLIRMYLLGSVLAIALMMRGLFPLHASTVLSPKGALAFMAPSGSGKSTLATYFHQQGYTLIADDVSLVKISPKQEILVWPAIPQLKLWPDSIQVLEISKQQVHALFPDWDKGGVRINKGFGQKEVALQAIIELIPNSGEEAPVLLPLSTLEKFKALVANSFRNEYILDLGKGAAHFQFYAQLAQRIPVYRLHLPHQRFALDQVFFLMENTLGLTEDE